MHHQSIIERLYRSHNEPVLRALQRKYNAPYMRDAVEDALAESWLILERRLGEEGPGYVHEDTFHSWLYVVARNELRRTIWRRKKGAELLNTDTESVLAMTPTAWTTEEEALANLELAELLDMLTEPRYRLTADGRQLVQTLSRGRRQAIMARLVGLTYHQTEEATGRTYTAVNRHVTEGRKVLREVLS